MEQITVTRASLVSTRAHRARDAARLSWWQTPHNAVAYTHGGSIIIRMKVRQNTSTKPSEPDKVDAYIQKLKHPLVGVVEALRQIILSTDREIGEEIKWNAPAFFFKGEMKPFNPREYKRHIGVFNLYKKDCIRLVFPSGAKINDASGLLEGDYADGRRLALFHNMGDVESKGKALR